MEINLQTESTVRHKRAKTETILQMDAMECGAVSLSIILAYFGKYISPEYARKICGVTRDGSKAINIIKAARHEGMNAHGEHIKSIEKLKFKPTPFIVFWEFNHFIVIEQVKEREVLINDPATGPRKISLEEFSKGYTGVGLFMSPGDKFQPKGQKEKSIFGILYDYIADSKKEILYILLLTILLSIPTASLSLFIKVFIDNVIIDGQSHWMLSLIIVMTITTILVLLMTSIQQSSINKFELKFLIEKVPRFFIKVINSPMSFFSQRASGDIASRFSIFNEIAVVITEGLLQGIVSFFTIAMYIVIICMINLPIGLITLLISMLNFVVLYLLKRRVIDLGRKISQEQAKLHAIEYSRIQLIEEIKLRSSEPVFFNKWASNHAQVTQSQQSMALASALISLTPSLLFYINTILLILIGSQLVIQGTITAGGLAAIYTLLIAFSQPVKNAVESFSKVNQIKGDLVRIRDVINAEEPIYLPQSIEGDKSYLLQIQDLNFGYSSLEPPVFLDINFNLKPGQSIAITGSSGGGKSSLANVICGFFKPWSGSILLYGKSIQSYKKSDLFQKIAYVDQSTSLFDGSIKDNVTLWDDTVSDDLIIQALKTACAYDWVMQKGGIDYHVKEGGQNLSVGQAQRIELARALVKKPDLIILDEVTSALDSVTEKKVYQNLRAINCSFIIIAHRLSAIRNCDTIIVLDDGVIIEKGSHEQLIKLNGSYSKLIEKEYLS